MGINQPKSLTESTSPYCKLYDAIRVMMNHGNQDAADLGTNLMNDLSNFESNENHQQSEIKNEFRERFLKVLHSKDEYFSANTDKTIQPLIHAIHKNFYAAVFLNKDHLSSFSFFQEKTEDVEHKPFSPSM